MKTQFILLTVLIFCLSCTRPQNPEALKKEIFQTEKAFEAMAAEKGIPEAFAYFADSNAVIKREHDTLISGRENIGAYYAKQDLKGVTVTWTAEFIDVSPDGQLGYTYGHYLWKLPVNDSTINESRGVFHTVWKRQGDGAWRYVWD
jgi:ketosteroid isomerase-like protein